MDNNCLFTMTQPSRCRRPLTPISTSSLPREPAADTPPHIPSPVAGSIWLGATPCTHVCKLIVVPPRLYLVKHPRDQNFYLVLLLAPEWSVRSEWTTVELR